MKRRGFLSLLGAAVTAPALPFAAPSFTPQIRALALAHAQKYPVVTVLGISKRIGVSVPDAEALLADMSRDGLLGAIGLGPAVPLRAQSRVFQRVPASLYGDPRERLQQVARRAQQRREGRLQHDMPSNWLAHLQALCVAHGFPLSPRAVAVAA